MNSRELAFKVLVDIESNNNYSNISINKHFKNIDISNNERGLATEIIYGVVEKKIYLDYIIDKLSKIKVQKLSNYVKIFLRMGIYQIVFLDISDYASVNETVNLAKKYDKKSSGFVNAILRNLIRNKDEILKIDAENENMYYSIKYSYSPWMIKTFIKDFGKEFTEDLLEANNERSNLYIRVNTLKITREKLMKEFDKISIKSYKVNDIEEALRVENLKNIENNDLFKKGFFTIQDISSMIVGKVMNPNKNSRVLDLCSAPGGKTTHIATLMENTGEVVSRDIFDHKLKLIKNSVDRLGLTNVKIEKSDASVIDKNIIENFDYVLCDVPCSGLGIIKRKPEIKYKSKEEIKDLPKLQYDILENASKYLKVGGVLIYSTCTILDSENISNVYKFLENNKNFELSKINEVNIDLENQENGYLKIYPNIHNMDGFFIAKLKKVR